MILNAAINKKFSLLVVVPLVSLLFACNGGGGGEFVSHVGDGEVRTIDGSSNNTSAPGLGSARQRLARYAASAYADGIKALAGSLRPSAREVSNAVSAQTESLEDSRSLSSYVWLWGQFIDHDIGITPEASPPEPADITVPAGDPFFDPSGTGAMTISFSRSIYDVSSGTDESNPREQINLITTWLDASMVYGSDEGRAAWLREFSGGRLRTSEGNLLPFNDGSQENQGGSGTSLFVAGDVRANENVLLTSIHTVFFREHNRLVGAFAVADPSLSDEELYQKARRWVGALVQAVTYEEFLPALLGSQGLPSYAGYDPSVDASMRNEFTTALYRMGHSMLPGSLFRIGEDGATVSEGALPLRDAFFSPDALSAAGGVDALLKGAGAQRAQAIDTLVIDDVRNFLFGPPGSGGFDLVSLNIQRGRDNGLADYNAIRQALGLSAMESFSQITSNSELASSLETLYESIDNIDAWAGALAEDTVSGSSVGELTGAGIKDQFYRLRTGDRFYYEIDSNFTSEEIREIKNTKLSDIIERNTGITNLPENCFFVN